LDVTAQMNLDTNELCCHALGEFAFLLDSGFNESHATGTPHFSIDYTRSDSRTIGVGACLPRYEYDVSLRLADNQYALDELAAVIEPDVAIEHDWAWAHSDADTFTKRITYSATVLRRLLPLFLDDDADVWGRVSARRRTFADAARVRELLKLADVAFADNRWTDAIEIYESIASLTPVQVKRLAIAKRRSK
jgi:hypothetical protein